MSGGLGALSMAWQAPAAGPLDGQTMHGRGAQPDQALRRLADELRRIRGSVTG